MKKDWWKTVKVGDVLESPSGTLRVVRKVDGGIEKGPRKRHVFFAIRHCSWTRRCYTVYSLGELMCLGYRPVEGRIALRTKLDKLIEEEFGRQPKQPRKLSCCDVIGIA